MFGRDHVENPFKRAIVLQCEECLEDFMNKEELSSHWQDEHGPKLYPCNTCRLKFITPSVLEKHKDAVHNKNSTIRTPYQCYVCMLRFISEEVLARHQKLVHPKEYHCGHCGKVFKLERKLRHHIQGKHILGNIGDEFSSKDLLLSTQLNGRGDNEENRLFPKKSSESTETLETLASDDHSSRHACGKCDKVFFSLVHLREHTCIHKFHCDDSFDSIDRLAVHKDSHVDEKPYVCLVCGSKSFTTIRDLRKHSSTCYGPCKESSEIISVGNDEGAEDKHEANQYKCQFCDEVCESKELLKRHVSHNHKSRHVCDTCGKELCSLFSHTGVKRKITSRGYDEHRSQYSCSLCVGAFKSELSLKAHIERKHTSCVCDKCGKVLSSLVYLSLHMNSVHKEVGSFICMICDKRCNRNADLRRHIRRHTGERPFECEVCDKGFISRNGFKKHVCQRVGDKSGDKQYKCPFCTQVFSSEEMVRGHIAIEHKSQVCGICGKVLYSSRTLQEHMNSHNGVKPFACMLCDKRFVRKTDLMIHLRTHTGERPFVCEVCSRSFINRSNLVNHVCRGTPEESSEESGEERVRDKHKDKQYKCSFCAQVFDSRKTTQAHIASDHNSHVCEICGKVLSTSYGLREHLLRHSGVKPFACTFCDMRFVRRPALTRHLRIHTGERPYVCGVCSKGFITGTKLKDHKCRGPVLSAKSDEQVEVD